LGTIAVKESHLIVCILEVILKIPVEKIPNTNIGLIFEILEHSGQHKSASNDI